MTRAGKSSTVFFECSDCERQFDLHGEILYLCPSCSQGNTATQPPRGVLKTCYDYGLLRKKKATFTELKNDGFIDLLPISDHSCIPSLRVGNTPLYPCHALDGKALHYYLYVKDDSQNPSFSYKDRASALVAAFAKERGINTIVAASTGNAGSSIACICAAMQQNAVVIVPENAPQAKISQVMMYGAHIVPVKGTYDQAFDLSIRVSERFGWYNRNTGYNPLTIEGKKTAAYELYEQMMGRTIGHIFVPVGDGVIITGLYKGFEDLLHLGIIDKIPIMVAVQAEKSDNLVRNLRRSQFESMPSDTIADSISVDIPRNFLLTKQYILKYHGEAITVSDTDILSASSIMARNTGVFAEPAAAAAFAGLLKYHREDRIEPGTHNIVMSTGSGLKDLKSLEKIIHLPEAIDPDTSFSESIWK